MAQACVQGHSAYIFDRGGMKRVAQIRDLSLVRWERVRDNVSEATVRLEGDACSDQAELIDSIRSHRHELVIFRGDKRVWEGPIHRTISQNGFAEIIAKDVLTYLYYQPLTQAYSNASSGGVSHADTVTNRLEQIITYELTHSRVQKAWNGTAYVDVTVPAWEALTPPANVLPHLDVHHYVNEARTTAVTVPYSMTVGEHLQSLGRTSGIDFTTVGRAIHIWDVSRSLGRLPTMTEANFLADVIVSEYGADHAQASYVVGQDGVYGSALATTHLDYYGPWTQIFTAYQEEGTDAPTQADLDSQSRRNISGRQPAPIEVRIPDNSTILLSDTLTIDDLVCGTQVMLRATLAARQLSQMQKIDYVRVEETPTAENITLTLTPATKPDSDGVPT